MFNVGQIQYRHFNERDVEGPALIDALQSALPIGTFLDVGAHYSWYTYAPAVKGLLNSAIQGSSPAHYMACDVLPCELTRGIADEYLIADFKLLDVEADFVSCISTIEHSGISTYKADDYNTERRLVFEALAASARRELFVTFPFGREGLYEGEYANVTANNLDDFAILSRGCALPFISTRFFYTEFAQGQKPWEEISIDVAKDVPLDRALGTQCVCIMHCKKEA